MSWKNLIPWDWFKHEDTSKSDNTTIPVKRNENLDHANTSVMSPMTQLHQDIDRIFDEAFNHFGMSSLHSRLLEPSKLWDSVAFRPNLNVSSSDNSYRVTVEAPGMEEDDLNIELRDDVMTITGNKKEEKEEKDGHFYRSERRYGAFQRVLSLPKDAKPEGIEANMKNGVLTIQIPREAVDDSQVKHIAIGQ